MMFKHTVIFPALMLTLGSHPLYAAQPERYDSTATAVTINTPTCFIGIVLSGQYVAHDHKAIQKFFYLHLHNPVNMFASYSHPTTDWFGPSLHQYDFQIFFNSKATIPYIMQFVGKTVKIIGSAFPLVHTEYHSPLPEKITILKIGILKSSATYKSICKAK